MGIEQEQLNEPDNASLNKINMTHYWLASLPPVPGILIWFINAYYLMEAGNDLGEAGIGVLITYVGASLIGGVISFLVNLFVPFANTARQAIAVSMPAMVVTILCSVTFGGIYELVRIIPFCIVFAALSVCVPISFLGFIGAKIKIAQENMNTKS